MTLPVFLSHQWLSFWRGRNANKSLALQIIVGVFYFLIFLEIAALGVALPFLLKETMPGKDPVAIFTSYIIYYFLVGLLVRFQLQELPSLSIQPYLAQNIRRKNMLRFLNVRSLVHVINFLPLFVFIPFTLAVVAPAKGGIAAGCFIIAMFALVINNHFLNMYIKRKSFNSSWWFFSIILIIAIFKGFDYFKIISFEKASANIFTALLNHPWLCILPVALAITTFLLNNSYLRNHLYIEELVSESKLKVSKNYAFLNRYGDMGEIIALDLKLIFRNKRPRSLVILSAVILLYGFIFYPTYLKTQNFSALFFFALLIIGIFISNYGQFLFAWQSSHFDGMMSYNINMKQYIKAKFLLFVTVCTLQFLIASFYGLMSWRVLPIQLAAFLYSIGINSFATIYATTFNYKYLDLRKSASLNFQGIGAVQWFQTFLILLAPWLVFFLLNKFIGFWVAIISISALGVIGLAFNEMIINWLVRQFNIRKHKILEGFRER
ncbi:MAG: DUF5687 family protein [Ferruginibacter sp.]